MLEPPSLILLQCAVEPLSFDDFFTLNLFFAEGKSSCVHSMVVQEHRVQHSVFAKDPTINPCNIDANSSFVGCCVHCCIDGRRKCV